MEIQVDKVTVRMERGTAVILGFDVGEVISEIGVEQILDTMDYGDVLEYVAKAEAERKEIEEDEKANR